VKSWVRKRCVPLVVLVDDECIEKNCSGILEQVEKGYCNCKGRKKTSVVVGEDVRKSLSNVDSEIREILRGQKKAGDLGRWLGDHRLV
jgi:hypothetical protein